MIDLLWVLLDVFPCCCDAFLCLVLIVCLSFLVATLDNDVEEVTIAGFYWKKIRIYYIAQDQGQTKTKASHPDACCYITYHCLSSMVLLLKFYKNWTNKTIFDVAITTNIIIVTIILPVVKTWCYQAHSHHMVYLPPKLIISKSLSGHPKHVF